MIELFLYLKKREKEGIKYGATPLFLYFVLNINPIYYFSRFVVYLRMVDQINEMKKVQKSYTC